MQRRDVLRLRDIRHAISKIREYAAEVDRSTARGTMAWDAILYNFAIIGEAAKALSDETTSLEPEADWTPAAKMRDFVIHQYTATDPLVIFGTIEHDLPKLERAVGSLLKRMEP